MWFEIKNYSEKKIFLQTVPIPESWEVKIVLMLSWIKNKTLKGSM